MKQTLIVFSCLHTAMFTIAPPKTGETVYCHKCGKYRIVAQAPHSYHVRCETCVYSREFGDALVTAETAAVKHATRKAGHRVALTDEGEEVRVFHHPVITMNVKVPPF